MFQFHTGSIKRPTLNFASASMTVFQFHTGSIKSWLIEADIEDMDEFQFHTGSIKRDEGGNYDDLMQECFNSILVRLKGVP